MVQPQQPMPVQKKGMPIWAWLAIGCVGLLMVCGVAFMAFGWWAAHKVKSVAEEYAAHPEQAIVKGLAALDEDTEVVSSDAATGKVTLKNKKTGEVITVDMADIKSGKINFQTKDGVVKTDLGATQQNGQIKVEATDSSGKTGTMVMGGAAKVPDWVPSYPGAASQGVYSAEDATQAGGTFGLETTDSVDQVFSNLKSQLERGGYKVTETKFNGPQGTGGMLIGESGDGKRSITFTLGTEEGKTKVAGVYSEKKG